MPDIPFEIIAFLFALPLPLLLVLANLGFNSKNKHYRIMKWSLAGGVGAISIVVVAAKTLQGVSDAIAMLGLGAFTGLLIGLWIESKVRQRNL